MGYRTRSPRTLPLRKATVSEPLAEVRTATPPPAGYAPEALWAPTKGVMRVWLFLDDQAYRLQLIHVGPDGVGWRLTKHSDGTTYDLFQADGPDITCDCPGATAHGPRCAGGRGCKHARMIIALLQVVDPGL